MLREISAFELLTMVKEGTAPIEVTYDGEKYVHYGDGDYVTDDDSKYLLSQFLITSAKKFITSKLISYKECLLNEEEKMFMRLLLSHMDDIKWICKVVNRDDSEPEPYARLCIMYQDPVFGAFRQYLPYVPEREWFSKLESNHEYTIRELFGED
jgi:hypothetical protein